MPPSKPIVYLAGPMSGCNGAQMRDWRSTVKNLYGHEFDFIDPCDSLVGPDESHYEVAREDSCAIDRCDALFAYLWKESMGTAHGVYYAKLHGKPVVVCDPNHLQNRMIAFYSDAVLPDLHESVGQLMCIIYQANNPVTIAKSSGAMEPYDAAKVTEALRSACRAARKNDVLVPAHVAPRVLKFISELCEGRGFEDCKNHKR